MHQLKKETLQQTSKSYKRAITQATNDHKDIKSRNDAQHCRQTWSFMHITDSKYKQNNLISKARHYLRFLIIVYLQVTTVQKQSKIYTVSLPLQSYIHIYVLIVVQLVCASLPTGLLQRSVANFVQIIMYIT